MGGNTRGWNVIHSISFSSRSFLLVTVTISTSSCNEFEPESNDTMVKAPTIGKAIPSPIDVGKALTEALNEKFNFIVIPIIKRDAIEFIPICDLLLKSHHWSINVIVHVDTSNLAQQQEQTSQRFSDLLSYSQHLGCHGVMFDVPLSKKGMIEMARLVSNHLGTVQSQVKFYFRLTMGKRTDEYRYNRLDQSALHPLISQSNGIDKEAIILPDDTSYDDTWIQWNDLRSLLLEDKRIGLCLIIPAETCDLEHTQRWAGEPVKFVEVHTNTFISNQGGFPVLSRAHQYSLSIMASCNPSLSYIVSGHSENMNQHAAYMRHVGESQKEITIPLLKNTEDLLQLPLQPLRDNLCSGTYEVFERDPVKYQAYMEAIEQAIVDCTSEDIVVLVVGAGRGPLVTAAIKSAEKVNKFITIYVVEKNQNAVYTLQFKKDVEWSKSLKAKVHVCESDIRNFECPQLADIVVSELLGSFGDNELSPECLDGVYKSVKPSAVSIPSSYSSYIMPLMSHKLFLGAKNYMEGDFLGTMYVVNMVNFYSPCDSKKLFTFDHTDLTLDPKMRDNTRSASVSFVNQIDFLCHGFAGFFETTLYKEHKLSIRPENHSKGMFSWFPMFIPLTKPVFIPKQKGLTINFCRKKDSSHVWYEWFLTEPVCTPIQNSGGQTQKIAL